MAKINKDLKKKAATIISVLWLFYHLEIDYIMVKNLDA